jgi:predicted nucleic acid-binding protein
MICYLDSNALVKFYVAEPGGPEVAEKVRDADAVGTVVISRVEVVAALGRASRLGVLSDENAASARNQFRTDWSDYFHLPLSRELVERASDLAWSYGLRGYDAVQLAAAVLWQDTLDFPVLMVTFDQQLWEAAGRAGLMRYPRDLRAMLDSWRT